MAGCFGCFPFKCCRKGKDFQYNLAPTKLIKMKKDQSGLGMKVMLNKDDFLEITFTERTGAIARSGLRIGDEIIEVNDRNVVGWTEEKFQALERNIDVGEKIKILVYRVQPPFPTLPDSDSWSSTTDSAESDEEYSLVEEDAAGPAPPDNETAPSTSKHVRVLSVGTSPYCDIVIHAIPTKHAAEVMHAPMGDTEQAPMQPSAGRANEEENISFMSRIYNTVGETVGELYDRCCRVVLVLSAVSRDDLF